MTFEVFLQRSQKIGKNDGTVLENVFFYGREAVGYGADAAALNIVRIGLFLFLILVILI